MSEQWRKREGARRHTTGNRPIDVRPKNWLTPLALLVLREKSSYGYELMNRLAKYFGFEVINPGTFYRALRHLEKDGLCESEWEASKDCGPGFRVYSITKAGEAYLRSWIEESKKYQQILDSFFLAYAGSRRPATSS